MEALTDLHVFSIGNNNLTDLENVSITKYSIWYFASPYQTKAAYSVKTEK